ncbi:MAG TPA: DUF5715 family protein [Granulicella sp.]
MPRPNAPIIPALVLVLPMLLSASASARTHAHHAPAKTDHPAAAKVVHPRKESRAERTHAERVADKKPAHARERRRRESVALHGGSAHHRIPSEREVLTHPARTPIPPEVIAALPPSPVRETGVARPSELSEELQIMQPPPAEDEAIQSAALRYNRRGSVIVPPPLKGSHEILVHQNVMADQDGLTRIQDDADLERMRRTGLLVSLPVNSGMQIDERLPMNRRYARPWTAQFLAALARAHYAHFHTPLQINSAVRTVDFQLRLMRTNGNAAPAEGETASPHLTGQAVDIAKHGLSMTEIAWMRGYLLPLVQQGKIDVEEEFQQACFHISVYRRYGSMPGYRRNIAAMRRAGEAGLAVAVP